MNEFLLDTRFWLTMMGSALVGVTRYLWKRQEKRLDAVEAEMVRRKELDQLARKLDSIETGITGTHRRIDDLYRDLLARDGGR